jgi:uncharacterized protein (TIGR03437 family)
MRRSVLFVYLLIACSFSVQAMDRARLEARVDEAVRKFGVSGRGVIVAILDRGLDWKNNDFRNADGTTRIDTIFDLTDNTGAASPDNPYKAGTIYTRAQINAALAGGTDLAHRDAVGHGTATTGIAAGNGRNSRDWKYRGEAPRATILVVKIVSGAAAHDDQPAEETSNSAALMPTAIDFVKDKARALNLPAVMLPNLGSVGGPMDGTSTLAKKIDATVGPGIPGLVLVTGPSDDGGIDNHAQATIAQGQSLTLDIDKKDANSLRFQLWYPQNDRYNVTIKTPSATAGPYTSPDTNSANDTKSAAGLSYYHYGSTVTPFGAVTRREILIDFSGPAGQYSVTLTATAAGGGKFDAWLNTVNGKGIFLNNVVPGYTVWDAASAFNNISPNDYVLQDKWADVDGVVRGIPADHVGDLWPGSGIGPTVDGRLGVDVSAPGNTTFASLAPKSVYGTNRFNWIQDGNGFYTAQNAVSGAAPQVTGIIALMLEINPTLDAAQVKKILQQTARSDAFTGTVPNTRWGYGKVDAAAAVAAAAAASGGKPYFTLDQNVFPLDAPIGSPAPAPVSVNVTGGNGAAAFSTSSSATWLTVDKASGSAPASLTITANPAGLSAGDYAGEITIGSSDGKAVPQSVTVHLHVRTPGPLITGIDDAATFGPGFANGSWVAIHGYDLANTTRVWGAADFQNGKLPTSLDGVSVRVFDRPAYVYFVSPNQINFLAPDNSLTNTRFAINVTNNGKTSNSFVSNSLSRNPEFFRFDGRNIAAVHLDGVYAGPDGLFPGVTLRPVKAGDTVLLFGTGCGATNPVTPADSLVTTAAPVSETPTLTIGGKAATVSFAGIVGSGLCQINAVIPDLPAGDAEAVLTIGTYTSSDGAYLRVQ